MTPSLLKELTSDRGIVIAQVTNDIEKGWKDMHSLLEKISNSGTLKPVLRFPFVSRGREGVENETNVLRFASFCELLRRPLSSLSCYLESTPLFLCSGFTSSLSPAFRTSVYVSLSGS